MHISCPTTWYDRCQWIYHNCADYQDITNWAAWQIGLEEIKFYLTDQDLVAFTIVWGTGR